MPVIYMGGWTTTRSQGQSSPSAGPANVAQVQPDADRLAARKMSAAGTIRGCAALHRSRAGVMTSTRRTSFFRCRSASSGWKHPHRDRRLPAQVYPPHEGLDKIQEEVRRLTATVLPAKQPPTLAK